jgi:hypothetical protein
MNSYLTRPTYPPATRRDPHLHLFIDGESIYHTAKTLGVKVYYHEILEYCDLLGRRTQSLFLVKHPSPFLHVGFQEFVTYQQYLSFSVITYPSPAQWVKNLLCSQMLASLETEVDTIVLASNNPTLIECLQIPLDNGKEVHLIGFLLPSLVLPCTPTVAIDLRDIPFCTKERKTA